MSAHNDSHKKAVRDAKRTLGGAICSDPPTNPYEDMMVHEETMLENFIVCVCMIEQCVLVNTHFSYKTSLFIGLGTYFCTVSGCQTHNKNQDQGLYKCTFFEFATSHTAFL